MRRNLPGTSFIVALMLACILTDHTTMPYFCFVTLNHGNDGWNGKRTVNLNTQCLDKKNKSDGDVIVIIWPVVQS